MGWLQVSLRLGDLASALLKIVGDLHRMDEDRCVFTHAHVGLRVEVHLNVHMPVIYFAFRVYIV